MGIVLSIIGTVLVKLLEIILVIFLLICALLFLPIHYKIKAERNEELLNIDGKISWICHCVFFRMQYSNGEKNMIFRLFGIDMFQWMEKRKNRKKAKMKKQKKKSKPQNKEKSENTAILISNEDNSSTETEVLTVQQIQEENENNLEKENKKEDQKEKKKQTETKRKRKETLYSRFKKKIKKYRNDFRNTINNIKKTWKMILKKKEWVANLRTFLKSDNTTQMVCILKDNVIHLWKKIKPRKMRGILYFGAGDPCLTGEILGAVSILYAYYGKSIQIVPDFNESKLEGNVFIKGHVSLITILVITIRILKSKQWNQFRKDVECLKEA